MKNLSYVDFYIQELILGANTVLAIFHSQKQVENMFQCPGVFGIICMVW